MKFNYEFNNVAFVVYYVATSNYKHIFCYSKQIQKQNRIRLYSFHSGSVLLIYIMEMNYIIIFMTLLILTLNYEGKAI